MNQAIICGRLVRDPEIRYTNGEEAKAVAKYTIAVDRMKDKEADFISCVAFGKSAEFAERYFRKRAKSIDFRSHSDRKLYQQGRPEGVYNRYSYSYTGVCRRQGNRTGKFKAVIIKCKC